jgi:hypothetical protein
MSMPDWKLKNIFSKIPKIQWFRGQRAPQGTIPPPLVVSTQAPLQTGESTQPPAPFPTSTPADTFEALHQMQPPTQPAPSISNQFSIPISSIDIKKQHEGGEIWEKAGLEDRALLDHFHATKRTAPGCFQGKDLEIRITNSPAIRQIAGIQFNITKDGKNASNVIISSNSYQVPFQQHPRVLSVGPVPQPTWVSSPSPNAPSSEEILYLSAEDLENYIAKQGLNSVLRGIEKGEYKFLDQDLKCIEQLKEDNPGKIHAFESPSAPGQYSGKALNFLLDTDKSNLNVLLEGDLFRLPLQNYRTLEKTKASKISLTITVDENKIAHIPGKRILLFTSVVGEKLENHVVRQNFLLNCTSVEKPIEEFPYVLKKCALVQQDGKTINYENPCFLKAEELSDDNDQKMREAIRDRRGISIDHSGHVEIKLEREHQKQRKPHLYRSSSESFLKPDSPPIPPRSASR